MPEAEHADVVVIGAGASGIPAAVGAAREGANVILAEEDDVPGGAPVDNYVTMPCGQPRTGVYREMLNRLDARFCLPVQSDGPVPPLWDRWYMPSSYLTVLTELLNAEPRVRLRCRTRPIQPVLESDRGQPCVRGLIVNGSNGQQHRIDAPVFIDATGDGSLAAACGAREMYGTDGGEDFGEPHAPDQGTGSVQNCTWMYISQRLGSGPPFDFRKHGIRLGVDPEFGWLGRDYQTGMTRNAGIYLTWGGTVSCEDTRDAVKLAAAQRAALDNMSEDIEKLQQNGFMVHLAPRIGVRESRRIVGEHVLCENDLKAGAFPEDTIAIGGWWMDIWGQDISEEEQSVPPYGIPYRSLLPHEVSGILVAGKAISVTHLALSCCRVQPTAAATGQAAGVAAAFCAKHRCQPADADIAAVQNILRTKRQNYSLPQT